jgi:hypothetical protein
MKSWDEKFDRTEYRVQMPLIRGEQGPTLGQVRRAIGAAQEVGFYDRDRIFIKVDHVRGTLAIRIIKQ